MYPVMHKLKKNISLYFKLIKHQIRVFYLLHNAKTPKYSKQFELKQYRNFFNIKKGNHK